MLFLHSLYPVSYTHLLELFKTIPNKLDREDRVYELMETVGLAERFVNSFPHELDGGRRQRIGVARALALDPKFIVCDEPVSALDVSIQAQILNLLMDLQDKHGLTYMFITHDLSVVKHISDEIAVLYLGECVERAPSKELFANPVHPYTKALPVSYTHLMLENASYESLKPKDICRMQWESVTAMEISAEGSTHRVDITKNDDGGASSDNYETIADDDSTNTEAETVDNSNSSEAGQYLYTENGKELSSGDMKNFKHIIDIMVPTGTADGAAAGENVLMKIVFHRNTEKFSEMVMTIYSYDEKSVRISFNGEENLLVSSAAADTLSELYNNLFN